MSGILLSCTCYEMPIIKQIADILGFVMNLIYILFDKIGIANIGLCIIFFTIIVKALMIPMSIKQQKTTKLQALINPEIQAIQKKYKGKNDNASMMAMNAETKAVYQKYGTSAAGGCLPLLLQMCILFALYGVVSNIPSHVGSVEDIYREAAVSIYQSVDDYDDLNRLNKIMVKNEIEGFEEQSYFNLVVEAYINGKEESKDIQDRIYLLISDVYERQMAELDINKDAWEDVESLKNSSLDIIADLEAMTDADWEKVKKSTDLSDSQINLVNKYAEFESTEYNNIKLAINDNYAAVEADHSEITDIYTFAGIDLSRSPSQEMQRDIWWAILIPILSAVGQWLTTYVTQKGQGNAMQDNPMASSLKAMNWVMPIMSAFFCYSFAAGLGLYWVLGSVFQIVQQIFINKYFKDLTVDDIIKLNIQKQNKKRAKKGLPPQKITSMANTNVKNIKVNTNTASTAEKKPNTSAGVTYKQGGIAAKANMVKEYNDKNNK